MSVCMVACNRAAYVGQAVDSALAQSYPNLEVVIVDDASDDGTWEILAAYGDPRLRLFRNPTRQGQAANRNRAIGLARGELIKILDDDDLLDVNCVTEMAASFIVDPRVGMAFCRRRILVDDADREFGTAFAEKYANLHTGFKRLMPVNDGHVLLKQWVDSGIRENWVG